MGEIKSVKVDNWGVFFLQKLQNFFNKTDYCDLTLQFRDNSQLKVHRLVLSACTDYFNVLEQTCEVVDDALLMPDELQADVVVPIVNFMYTGTLEFELKMYGKLLRTAKEMNMTVLLKLLEAHRRTMEGVSRSQRPPSPKTIRRRPIVSGAAQQPQAQQQLRHLPTSANVSPQQGRVVVQTKNIATSASTQQQPVQYRQQIGSTSLLRTSTPSTGAIRTQYGTTTIYSNQQQQYYTKREDYQNTSPVKQQPTSPFEQLRKGYNNNKRPAPTTLVSPPAKKPNIEDVKEFAEQQRMRKQIAAEYADDPDYEPMLDDDIHNDDDDDEQLASGSTGVNTLASTSKQQVTQQAATTTITFKQEPNDKPPTIVVKDSSNSKMNHAKIISEVLRQYPHLVKGNKNIKLKILPNPGGQSQKIIVKKEPIDGADSAESDSPQQQEAKLPVLSQTLLRSADRGGAVQKPAAVKQTAAVQKTSSAGVGTSDAAAGGTTQKRRIDSKTMHTLIALGAENTTGPWLCLRCGVNGRPISIPSYRGFRRHLINTHKETIDMALCEHCGWRSGNNRELHYHMQVEHKVRTTLYTFPECLMCADILLDTNALNQHMMESHADENKQQCIYCNKIFAKELQLYTHMKTFHKKQALEDGIIDDTDDEFLGDGETVKKDGKIKILSDISLPSAGTLLKLEPSSEAAALSTVASGIATSIAISGADDEFIQPEAAGHTDTETADEPKFVNADGNEMLLTEEQRKEIMSQLNEGGVAGSGGVVMVLNETAFSNAAAEAAVVAAVEAGHAAGSAGDEGADNNTTGGEDDGASGSEEDDYDDSQIYNELTSQSKTVKEKEPATEETVGAKEKTATTASVDESKESMDDSLEWAENLISAHEMADEAAAANKPVSEPSRSKKADDISTKLKELTGDWSDDENEGDDEADVETEEEDQGDKTIASADQKKEQADGTAVETDEQHETEETAEVATTKDAMEKEKEADELIAESKESDEPSLDEDDIEIAMKSLHKDDDVARPESALLEKESPPASGTDKDDHTIDVATDKDQEVEIEKAKEVAERKMSVDDDVLEKEHTVNDEHTEEEIKIKVEKESPIKAAGSLETAQIDNNAEKAQHDTSSKSLLAELIAEADISKDDEEEFISEKDDGAEKVDIKMEKSELPIAITEAAKSDIAAASEIDAASSVEKEYCAETEISDRGDKGEDHQVTAVVDNDGGGNDAAILLTDEAVRTEDDGTKTSSNIDATMESTTAATGTTAVTATTTTATADPKDLSTVSQTADKVKSLISEWGDDDDDDDGDEL